MKRKINTGIQGRDREKTQQTNVPRSDEVRDNDEEADFSYAAADRTQRRLIGKERGKKKDTGTKAVSGKT
jgi:hypothetical protein